MTNEVKNDQVIEEVLLDENGEVIVEQVEELSTLDKAKAFVGRHKGKLILGALGIGAALLYSAGRKSEEFEEDYEEPEIKVIEGSVEEEEA